MTSKSKPHATSIGNTGTGKIPYHLRKGRWFSQLSACYGRGYQAGLDKLKITDCPYKPSSYGKGLQQQRIDFWKTGFQRAVDGKPIDDTRSAEEKAG